MSDQPVKMLRAGDEVITMFTFGGDRPEDLAFRRKDVLTVLGPTKDPNWLRAKHSTTGKIGFVPMNYVKKADYTPKAAWFHGQIARLDTENMLERTQDGTFIVRESVKYRGDYTLSVHCAGTVHHYHISRNQNRFTVDDEELFLDLESLVKHYMAMEDGLCCRLTEYVTNHQQLQLDALESGGWVKRVQDIQLLERIGSGEFGEVRKGIFKNMDVAVKCFKKDTNPSEEDLFTYEASVMTSLSHPNLVTFIGLAYMPNEVYLITEFMENGSLVNYLRSRGRSVITKEDQLRFATDTCCGMTYLEEKCLVHRDLAARNVLLGHDLAAKVADFGLARVVTDESGTTPSPATSPTEPTSKRIPIKWTAPEAVKLNKFSTKSDVWGFGVLLWEIYSFGRMPYPRLLTAQVVRNLELGYRMESPEDCPVEIYDIMKLCWDIDPAKRPNFAQMLSQLQVMSGGVKQVFNTVI